MYETKVNSPKGKLQCKFVSAQASHPRNFKGSKQKQKQYDKTKKINIPTFVVHVYFHIYCRRTENCLKLLKLDPCTKLTANKIYYLDLAGQLNSKRLVFKKPLILIAYCPQAV